MESQSGLCTEITFRGGVSKTVTGSPDDIAEQLRQQRGDPIRLIRSDGEVLFVNWANVLFLEPSEPSAAG